MAPFPPASSRGGILSLRGRERIPSVPVASQDEALSTGMREELQDQTPFPESPRFLILFQGNLFSLHCFDFQAEDHLTPRWHVGQPCGEASWESFVGKPRGKATDPLIHAKGSVTLLPSAGEESARACPHSRRGLTPQGRLRNYPKIHVSTGEESSGSRTDSKQDLRPRHRRERNPERLPSNSHGDWPFLRPPERVPEAPP